MDYNEKIINNDMKDSIDDCRLHAKELFVPILNGFKIQSDDNPKAIMSAKSEFYGITVQLISDGVIGNDSFDNKISSVIQNEKLLSKNKIGDVQSNFMYFKDFNNGLFDFKIFVCDIINSINNNNRQVFRKFYAFFVEPMKQDFYQVIVTVGPLKMPTEQLKLGKIDLQNDQVTFILNDIMNIIISNIKYKNNEMNKIKKI